MAGMDDPLSIYKDAFTRLKQAVSPDDSNTFQSTTLVDVLKTVLAIQKEQRKRRSLCNMAHIAPLMSFFEKYSTVVKVMCNGTPYLPSLWAPIPLMLQIASPRSEVFNKLLNAYVQMAKVLPQFDHFPDPLKDDSSIQHTLAMIYRDILEFHTRCYEFFRPRSWRVIFPSPWNVFERGQLCGIYHSLERCSDILDKKVSLAVREARIWMVQHQNEIERQEIEEQVISLQPWISWLSLHDHFQGDDLNRLLQLRQPKSCDWIFGNHLMISWLENPQISRILWITGPPGAGKSVLTAHIIERWQSQTDMNPIYYICHRNTNGGGPISLILRTQISQLLRLQPKLSSQVIAKYLEEGQPPSPAQTRKVLLQVLSSTLRTPIIVDGLDECDKDDQTLIISELMALVKSTDAKCQLLVSSRQTTHLSQLLREFPVISVSRDRFRIAESQVGTTAIDAREHAAFPMRRLWPRRSVPTGQGQSGNPFSSQEPNPLVLGQSPTSGNEDAAVAASLITDPRPDSSSLTCRMCKLIYILWFALITGSLANGLWRSFATSDEGKGFTDAAYVVAVGGLIIYPFQSRHYQRCRLAARNGG